MMSVQNEPEAVQTWESCLVSAEEEAEYVKYHLYPALKKYGLDTEIYIWDHNRDRVARRAAVTARGPKKCGISSRAWRITGM